MSQGAIYIITHDERYVNLLLNSAASLKRAMPNLPITVFSEFPIANALFEKVISIPATQDGFYDKVLWMSKSPYDRTLFIDADTYIIEPFPELFVMLDQFDIAVTHEEYLNTDWFSHFPRPDVPSSFPEFNTGILCFKQSPKVLRFFQEWHNLYATFQKDHPTQQINDQPFFRVAAYYSDVRIATLTREYNCKFRGQGYLNGKVKVLHGHHEFHLDHKHTDKVIRVLNASTRPRVYIAGQVLEQKITGKLVGHRTAHKVGSFPEPPESITLLRLKRLRKMIREQGLSSVITKARQAVLGR